MGKGDDIENVRKDRDKYRKRVRELEKKLAGLEEGSALPSNPDAEKAVLACALMRPSEIVARLRTRWSRDGAMGETFFYVPANKLIWRAMIALWTKVGTFDLVTLNAELLRTGDMDKVGGHAKIADLIDDVPTTDLLDSYVDLVEADWHRRNLFSVSLYLRDESLDGDVGRGIVRASNQIEQIRDAMTGSEQKVEVLEAIELFNSQADFSPVFCCDKAETRNALRDELKLASLDIFDVEVTPELKRSANNKWIIVVIEGGNSGKATAWLRQIMDHCYRVAVINLDDLYAEIDLWQYSAKEYIKSMMDAGSTRDWIISDLLRRARTSSVPQEVVYDSLHTYGAHGGVTILQARVAARLVRYHDLHYSGNFWQWDTRGFWALVKEEETVAAWVKRALSNSFETLPSISSNLVDSVAGLMRSESHCHPDELNRTKGDFLINARNGMLHVLTGELKPHDRKYLSTTQVSVEWDPEAECPNWLAWLREMKPEEDQQEQIQEMFGYCLVPAINYHVFFFLYGQGGTGKSTCADVLQMLVGEENTLALQLEELGNPFTRSQLVGKQVYLCGELTRQSFKHIGLIKQISAGEPIYVDVKHRPGFSFRPMGRFVMTSNVVAHTPDTSTGFERRFLQITWKKQIPRERQDFNLKEKFEKELPGILRWAVEGFVRLYERGHFAHTVENQEAIKDLMRHRDQIKSFRNDSQGVWVDWDSQPTEQLPNGCWCENPQLFEQWVEWCQYWGVKPFTDDQRVFFRELFKADPTLKERAHRSIPPGQSGGDKTRWMSGIEILEGPSEEAI